MKSGYNVFAGECHEKSKDIPKMNTSKSDLPAPSSAGRRRIWVPVAVVVLAAAAYAVYWLLVVRGTVFTDDAQTQGLLVPCSSRVGGRVVEFLAWEGEAVKKGQPLARLDEMPYRAQRDEAKAAVDLAQAQLEAAELKLRQARAATDREVAMAEAELAAAQAREELARKEKGRFHSVERFVARETVDQVSAAWSGADAALKVAKEKLSLLSRPGAAAGDTAPAPRELELEALANQAAAARASLAGAASPAGACG
jgi:membrane fusion protein (multidrug efflux system)